jgi:hypothetical protein
METYLLIKIVTKCVFFLIKAKVKSWICTLKMDVLSRFRGIKYIVGQEALSVELKVRKFLAQTDGI